MKVTLFLSRHYRGVLLYRTSLVWQFILAVIWWSSYEKYRDAEYYFLNGWIRYIIYYIIIHIIRIIIWIYIHGCSYRIRSFGTRLINCKAFSPKFDFSRSTTKQKKRVSCNAVVMSFYNISLWCLRFFYLQITHGVFSIPWRFNKMALTFLRVSCFSSKKARRNAFSLHIRWR